VTLAQLSLLLVLQSTALLIQLLLLLKSQLLLTLNLSDFNKQLLK
jgi:hypothetical protein